MGGYRPHSALLALALWACSSPPAHPPELGNCVPADGGACTYAPTGGDGGGVVGVAPPTMVDGSTGSSACTVSASDSLCNQCLSARCCDPLNACTNSATCWTLNNCETSPTCLGGAACVAVCEGKYMSAVTLYAELTSCLALDCAVCNELGVGDPCTPQGTACNPGLTCNGSWCTKACAGPSDCTGLGPSGANTLGLPNACVTTTGGNLCAPGCITDADCTDFPATYCVSTTSANASQVPVNVCGTTS
jgi:hypothetical protein